MTDAAKKLVEDNHNLIYSFLTKQHLLVEEYYDVAAIGLCKAAMMFDPDKGYAFSTLAYKAMFTEVQIVWRRQTKVSAIPDSKLLYYSDSISDTNGVTTDYLNFIPDSVNVESEALTNVTIEKVMRGLRECDKQIFELLLLGYKQRDIAKIVGYSQPHVSRIVTRIKNKLKED